MNPIELQVNINNLPEIWKIQQSALTQNFVSQNAEEHKMQKKDEEQMEFVPETNETQRRIIEPDESRRYSKKNRKQAKKNQNIQNGNEIKETINIEDTGKTIDVKI